MNRAAVGLDRVLGTLVAVVLIVLGAGGILWWHGTLHRRAPSIGVHTDGVLLSIRHVTTYAWWPWVAGIAGLVLGLLALWWLLSHATYRGVHDLRLRGSGKAGRVTASTSSVFTAAAEQLQQTSGVRRVGGGLTAQRGALIADLRLTIDSAADLTAISAGIDRAAADLATSLDNPDVTYRATASVARRFRGGS